MATSRSLGSLTLDLIMKIGGFTGAADKASRSADKNFTEIEKRAYEFGEKIGEIMRNAAAAFGIGFGVEKFLESIKESINSMDEMSKAAQKVGLTTEEFSGLKYAADLANVGMEDLESSLGKLTKSMGAALDPTSQQAKIFKALGINVTDASGKLRSSADVLKDFADKFELLGGNQEAINAGFALFGKSFQTIIPMLKDGGKGISDLQDEAAQLNNVIGTDAGHAAEEFNDNLTRVKKAVEGVYNGIAVKLLPTLEDWSSDLVDLAKDNSKLDDVATGVADTLQGLAAIAHTVAAGFKFITASIQTVTIAAAGLADVWKATDNDNPFDPKMWAQVKQIQQNVSGQIDDVWKQAKEGIDSSFDAAGKNIDRISGKLVDLPKRQLAKGADDFISSIFGDDKETQKKADALNKALHGVLSNADRDAKEAAKSAQELADAYAALNDAVAKVNESTDPSQQAYAKYADTIRKIDELGAKALQKGGDVTYVQGQVAQAVASAMLVLQRDLEAPMKAAQDFNDNLQKQLELRQQQVDLQAQSVGMGDKEAQRLQELTSITQQGTKAIADFEKQYQDSVAKGKPNATQEQYASELKGLQDYWSNVYKITQDGYATLDQANTDFLAGINKAVQNFIDQSKDLARIGDQLGSDFLNGASDALAEFADGTKSAKDALKDFLNSFESEVTKAVSKQLMAKLFDTGSGSGGGDTGSWISTAFSALFGGGRAIGGPVAGGKLYEVNENGAPETLSVGGKDFLLMGKQGGVVKSASAAKGAVTQNIENNYRFDAPTSLTTQTQLAQRQAYEINRARRLA